MTTQRKPDARAGAKMTAASLATLMRTQAIDTLELAERLGVTRRTVQHWLAGKGEIPYLAAYAIRHL